MPTFLINFGERKEMLQGLNSSALNVVEKKQVRHFIIQCQPDVFSALTAAFESNQLTFNDLNALIQEKTEYLKTGNPDKLEEIIQREAAIIEKTDAVSADR